MGMLPWACYHGYLWHKAKLTPTVTVTVTVTLTLTLTLNLTFSSQEAADPRGGT